MSLKIALTCGSVATVVGGSYGAYYLLQGKTIENELTSRNLKLIKTDDDYQIAFREEKDTPAFITLLNSINKTGEEAITSNSGIDKGGIALKKWCKANLSLSKNKDNKKTLQNVEKYCVKTLFTIKDKMKRKRRKLVEDLSQNLSTLKSSSADADLQKDLGSINSEIKDINAANEDVVKEALRIWCDNNITTDLTKDKEDELWKKINRRCLGPEG